MPFEIKEGKYQIFVSGKNASILRGSKKIELKEGSNDVELKNNDIFVSGKETTISVNCDKSHKDYKKRVSLGVTVFANGKFKIDDVEEWDNIENHERRFGRIFGKVELIKGLFIVGGKNSKPILASVCSIREVKEGSDFGAMLDVYEDKVYASPTGPVLFTNLKTKKSFIAKSPTPEEIIVTTDAIYRKGMLHIDTIFNNKSTIGTALHFSLLNSPEMMKSLENLKENLNDDTKGIEAGLVGLEAMRGMKSEDMKRLYKMHGQELTPEMEKQLDEIPNLMKKMEEHGMSIDKIQEQMALFKGYKEQMDKETVHKQVGLIQGIIGGTRNMSLDDDETNRKRKRKVIEEANEMLNNPRKYNPLTGKFGAVRVG